MELPRYLWVAILVLGAAPIAASQTGDASAHLDPTPAMASRPAPQTVRIAGRVVGSDGPLAGSTVRLVSTDMGPAQSDGEDWSASMRYAGTSFEQEAGPDGTFAFDVEARGKVVRLSARAPGSLWFTVPTELRLAPYQATRRIDIELRVVRATVRGMVRREDLDESGDPLFQPYGELSAWLLDEAAARRQEHDLFHGYPLLAEDEPKGCQLDGDRSFVLRDVPAGRWVLRIGRRSAFQTTTLFQHPIQVETDGTVDLGIVGDPRVDVRFGVSIEGVALSYWPALLAEQEIGDEVAPWPVQAGLLGIDLHELLVDSRSGSGPFDLYRPDGETRPVRGHGVASGRLAPGRYRIDLADIAPTLNGPGRSPTGSFAEIEVAEDGTTTPTSAHFGPR
jgi:hypothetical protein